MSRGMPSMTALLGLLAVAGYQNRDKIKEMLGGVTKSPSGIPRPLKAVMAALWAILAVSLAAQAWGAY